MVNIVQYYTMDYLTDITHWIYHIIFFFFHSDKNYEVYAIRHYKAHKIVKLLVEDIVPMFGVPEALLSDRDTNLLSHLTEDFCKLLDKKKLSTTAHYFQCNGMIKRFNWPLKCMLRNMFQNLGCSGIRTCRECCGYTRIHLTLLYQGE